MVNGVNNQNYINPYLRNQENAKKAISSSKDAPPFLLDYDEKGVIWEHPEGNKKNAEADKKEKINNNSKLANDTNQGQTKVPIKNTNSRVDTLKENNNNTEFSKVFYNIFSSAKSFFSKLFSDLAKILWYGDEKENVEKIDNVITTKDEIKDSFVKAENDSQELAGYNEKAQEKNNITADEKEQKIRELLRNKDTEGVMDILTEHQTKHLAMNSNLLTQYDRHGKVISPTSGNQNLILNGDKSIKM